MLLLLMFFLKLGEFLEKTLIPDAMVLDGSTVILVLSFARLSVNTWAASAGVGGCVAVVSESVAFSGSANMTSEPTSRLPICRVFMTMPINRLPYCRRYILKSWGRNNQYKEMITIIKAIEELWSIGLVDKSPDCRSQHGRFDNRSSTRNVNLQTLGSCDES